MVCTSVGVVFLLGACFYFRRRGYYTRRLGFTFVGVVLPLFAWFYLCRQGLTFLGVVSLLWAWYFHCSSGITSVWVVSPLCAWFDLCRRVYYL